MALGNWFTVAWDIKTLKELPELGILKTENYEIETYKNWLYIKPKGLKYPIAFNEGSVDGEFYINSKRVDNLMFGEVFIFKGTGNDMDKEGFYFISGYGYQGEAWVGCTDAHRAMFRGWLAEEHPHINRDFITKSQGVNQGELYLSKKFAEIVSSENRGEKK